MEVVEELVTAAARMTTEEQKEDCEAVEVISVTTLSKDNFIKTRNGNLRCFPHCSTVHNDRAFCGDSLTFFVIGNYAHRNIKLIGEFRPQHDRPTFQMGQRVTEEEETKYMDAKIVQMGAHNDRVRFSFNPKRKWEYKNRENHTRSTEPHVFTAYCLLDDRVAGMAETAPFQLIPIWKAGGQEGEDTVSIPDPSPHDTTSATSTGASSSSMLPVRSFFRSDSAMSVHNPLGTSARAPPIPFAAEFSPALLAPSSAPNIITSPFPLHSQFEPLPSQFNTQHGKQPEVTFRSPYGSQPSIITNSYPFSPAPPMMPASYLVSPIMAQFGQYYHAQPPQSYVTLPFAHGSGGTFAPGSGGTFSNVYGFQTSAFGPQSPWTIESQKAAAYGKREEALERMQEQKEAMPVKKSRAGSDAPASRM